MMVTMMAAPVKTRTKVYHIIYEPSFNSIVFHHGPECNLKCRGCYCNVEMLDFSIIDDWKESLCTKEPCSKPERFLNIDEIYELIKDLKIERAIFIGTEPGLDSGFPVLAKLLRQQLNSYNILFTNGIKLPELSDIDEIIVSLKAITPEIYRDYTGADNANTLANFRKIYEMGKNLQTEILFIPGVVEELEVEKAAEFVASIDRSIPFRINGYFEVQRVPYRAAFPEEVEKAARLAGKYLDKVNFLSADMPRVGEKPIRIV